MMMISHDLSVLADVSDRIAVMYAGRIVEQGPADLLFTDPLHPYTRALSGVVPADRRPGRALRAVGPAGRPARPARAAAGVLVRARAARWPSSVPAGRAAAGGQGAEPRAACIRVVRRNDRRAAEATAHLEARGVARRVHQPQRRVATPSTGPTSTVRSGEIVALVGESGSGKTTLARTLTGLEPPTAGEVLVDG